MKTVLKKLTLLVGIIVVSIFFGSEVYSSSYFHVNRKVKLFTLVVPSSIEEISDSYSVGEKLEEVQSTDDTLFEGSSTEELSNTESSTLEDEEKPAAFSDQTESSEVIQNAIELETSSSNIGFE